jgi:hypothetical protein
MRLGGSRDPVETASRPAGSRKPAHNTVGTRTSRRRGRALRPAAHNTGRWHRPNKQTTGVATEVAGRPRERHTLLNGFPNSVQQTSYPIAQNNSVTFCPHPDVAGQFIASKPLTLAEEPLALPAAHIDRLAGLACVATTERPPSHRSATSTAIGPR